MPDLTTYPIAFPIACLMMAGVALRAWSQRRKGWGIPACAVMATTFFWYAGDVLYNDFASYQERISADATRSAWWQVCLFVASFAVLVPGVTRQIAGRFESHAAAILEQRPLDNPGTQRKIDLYCKSMVAVWVVLMGIALIRIQFDFAGLFAPYLGHKTNPWGRGRVGGGISSLLSLAEYFQIFLTAGFGCIFAVSQNKKTRTTALIICLLAFPFYIFDRTRNTMLAVMLPGISAWVFYRIRGHFVKKLVYLLLVLIATSIWFSYVVDTRTETSVAQGWSAGRSIKEVMGKKHLGLNMLEELAWINHLRDNGTFNPPIGARYFAEAVNPIPRALWPGKPLIGLDYAVARGLGVQGASAVFGGVFGTLSTGMVGQGVVNFGGFFGPIAAAFLISIWVGLLAWQDRRGASPARLMLYALGLVLTFNMGRDITLLVMYPFLLGWIVISYWERKVLPSRGRRPPPMTRRPHPEPGQAELPGK